MIILGIETSCDETAAGVSIFMVWYRYMSTKTSKKNLVPKSRVPISFLIDYIKEGLTISDFLASYPWINRKNVEKALEEIKNREFTSGYAL